MAVLLVATIVPQLSNIEIAKADDGGYPWVGATQLFTTPVTYDWGYSTCPTNDAGCMGVTKVYNSVTYGEDDPYTMDVRNCTSYAAWKINQYVSQSFSSWGNASNWHNAAPTADVHAASDYTPVFGDLALWDSAAGGLGHVAFVFNVEPSGTADLYEYNAGYPLDGGGHAQWGLFYSGQTTASGSRGTPDYYIHIPGVLPTTTWGGVGTSSTYSGGNGMASGTTLLSGYYLESNNGQNAFLFQSSDRNAVVYSGGHSAFPFGTGGQGGTYLDMQTDGNLVMYKADHTTSIWQSFTSGNPGATLTMQDDGNLVVYSSTGTPLWWSGTGGNPNLTYFGSDRLTSALGATELTQGQYIRSADHRYTVLMQTNGDAVLYGPGAHQLWHTNTAGHGDHFIQQTDGNLVLYAFSTPYWDTGFSGTSYYTVIQNDGNFVQYNSTGSTAIWPSGTGGQI